MGILLLDLGLGFVIGLSLGLLGVGGGFLIVPALVMVVGLPIVEAVSTSLIIISANGFCNPSASHLEGVTHLTVYNYPRGSLPHPRP